MKPGPVQPGQRIQILDVIRGIAIFGILHATLLYAGDFMGNYAILGFILLACGIFVIQVILSRLWLSRFKFGPLERLLRAFAYLRK